MNGNEDAGGSGETRELTDIEKVKVQGFCEELWAEVRGCLRKSNNQEHFDLLMGQVVLEKAKALPDEADQQLLLAASQIVQARVTAQMSAALRKAAEEDEA